VFDGVSPVPHEGWSVLVEGDKIAAVGPNLATPAGARTIDLPGETLMPGMIEGHSHLFLHPYNETLWDDQVLHEPLALRTARAVVQAERTLDAGTLDGGDVLRIGRTLYVGLSSRTNTDGVAALRSVAAPLGYEVVAVEPSQCLHLKTAVTFAGEDAAGTPRILVNPRWVDPALFDGAEPIRTDEPAAANCLRVGDRLILPSGNPRTAAELRRLGFDLVELDVSELQKAEAGVTCMSLIDDDLS
jgi:arginine deiminase